jgi:hypothetical protein
MARMRSGVVALFKVELTDDQRERFWSVARPNAILKPCPSLNMLEEYDFEGTPGQSDTSLK